MKALALCVFLAACGASSVGDSCKKPGDCGEGSVCDMTDPGGPVCIDADGDLDGDGIPNDKDFCEHMPGGAFDEDRDGIGDECDRCPIAAPLAEPDPDGDDVDAPCDPDPRTPGDKIVLFEGFNGALPAGWKAGADWQIVGGTAVVTPSDTSMSETMTAPIPMQTTHLAVLTAYRIDVANAAVGAIAGVSATDNRPAGKSTTSCVGLRTSSGDVLSIASDRGNMQKDFTDLFSTSGLYQVAEDIENAQAACALIADTEQGAVQTQTLGAAPNEAALEARGATVRFGYLLVVQRP